MEFHRCVIHCLSLFKHGEVINRTGIPQRIIGKCHIPRSQLLPIRKHHVIPYGHGPGQAIVTGLHAGRQVIADFQIRRRHRQGTLD